MPPSAYTSRLSDPHHLAADPGTPGCAINFAAFEAIRRIVNDKPRDDDPADLTKLKDQFKDLESDTGPMPAEGAASEKPSTESPPIPEAPASPPSRPPPSTVPLLPGSSHRCSAPCGSARA